MTTEPYALKGTDRQRFNDGFWDGIATRERPTYRLAFAGIRAALDGKFTYDSIWAEGVRAGYAHQGERPETSDGAWAERQNARKAAAASRKAQRELRPSASRRY